MAAAEGQQHPLKIYWIMWGALFVLSAMSYATDFMDDGALRTFCILLFMMLKAGGIVYIFMHMGWTRPASRDPRADLADVIRGLLHRGHARRILRRKHLRTTGAATPLITPTPW
jgi:hypothetical protein